MSSLFAEYNYKSTSNFTKERHVVVLVLLQKLLLM